MDATQRRSYRKFLQILREKPIVADFMCPIGGRPMTDPVVAEDGYSYERSAIEAWLQDKELSPQTRNLMGSVLEGNSDLKEAIDELKAVLENPPSEELTITWNSPGPTPLQRTLVISPPAETSDSSDWEVLTPTSPAEGQTNGARQRAAQAQDMSYTLSKIFRVLDPLRGLLLEALDGWTPQRMIVVGDESAGKSTILEMLAMLPIFPRKRRFCTRLATHLRLRRNPDVCRTTLSVYTVTPQGDQLEGEAMVVPKENGHLFVQEKMDHLVSELSKGQEGAGSGGIVTRKIIVIEVQGPEVPSIDLVDLPGITSWPKEKAEAVQQIMKKQIRDDEATGNNNMFLAVVPASGDVKPNTNNAMKFIMENQLQDRTVGVFSKCDQTSRSGSDILRALTLNESTKEGESAESLGRIDLQTWVASMLEPPQEFSNNFERLELQRKSEVEFFEKADENFQHVYRQGHAGMRALIANIERSYLKHLNTTWKPNAMRKVLLKEKEVDFQLCMLGLVEDEAARSSLAKEEVERRLGVTSPVTKSVYEDFILHALRKDLAVKVRERLQRYSGSGLTCEGCEQVEEMNLLEKDLLNLISGALDQVGAGLVFPLQKWLYAKSEVVQIPNTELVNVCTKFSDGFSLMHFEKHLSKKELVQKLHSEPILQLCNYSGYLDEIMSKCKQMHLDAGTRIQNKAAQLAANFVNLDGSSDRRMEVTPRLLSKNDEVSKVKLHCNVNQFLGDLMALFLREIPSPKKLQTLHEGVKVGKERPEAEQKLMRLKEEIRKIGVARDGIRRALDIGDEEFDQMRQELEAEAGSADCCLSREGGSSADADTMSSLKASSCELLIPSEASVQDLKELIRKELGEPSERQLKLTSKGDELEDQHSVKDLGIAEVDFLVVDGSQDAALSADAPRLLGALKARGGRGGAKDGKAKSEEEALPPQAAFLLDVSHVPADDLEAMSLELPAVSDLVQKAKSVVGCSTTARTFNVNHGPLHGFIGSLAGLEKFKNDKPQASGAASIVPVGPGGTLAAFCAAGVMTIEDGLRLAKLAEDATAELASSGKKQRAICVTGFKKALVSTLCQQAAAKEDGGVCSIAAFISRDTFFVSGTEPAISSFEKLAKASPGHCEVSTKGELGCCSSLMQTVQEKLNESLDVLLDSLKPPTTAVWMTTEAKILRPRADPVEILEVLKRLLTSPLLFDQCMKAALEDGVREFYHCNATQKMIVENISDEILERHRCDDEF